MTTLAQMPKHGLMETLGKSARRLGSRLKYWRKSAANLLRMGHCAPTVMQTLLDVSEAREQWPVRLSAGMPGGIGNTGFECGAVTSPLAFMGLHYGLREADDGLPAIFDKGYAVCQASIACHKTINCKQIRGKDRFPLHCIRPVFLAPQLLAAATASDGRPAIPPEVKSSYRRTYSHFVEQDFHCARAVLDGLHYTTPQQREVCDAASAFIGGTLFMGMTCSAFTAGVMAIGLQTGEIEDSPSRVMRLLYRMTFGGDAFDERINKFNRSMNAGYRMSRWFAREFGNTQCREITQCDFSSLAGASKYIDGGYVTKCREIATKVADRVQKTVAELQGHPS